MFAQQSVGSWLVQVMAALDVHGSDLTQCWRDVVLVVAQSPDASAGDLRLGFRQAMVTTGGETVAEQWDQALRQHEQLLTEFRADLLQRWSDVAQQIDRVADELSADTQSVREQVGTEWILDEEAGRYWRQGPAGKEWAPVAEAEAHVEAPADLPSSFDPGEIAVLKAAVARLEAQ